MALSFGESIRRNSPKASTFKLNALRSDAPALLSEEWEMDDNYLIYDEYSDENISEINDIKEIKMHPKQINLTQESNSQYIPFVASRYYDGFDFTTVTLSFHFTNKNGDEGYSAPINVAYNDKQIKFAWLVDNRVTAVEGRVDFEVMAVGLNSKGDDYTWRTKPCSLNVIKSLSGNGVFEPGAEWLNGFISKVAERAAGMIETVTGGNASIHVGSAETMPEGTKILIDPDGEAYEMLEVDDTLTRTGYAADAAKVGTEINNIREDMMNFGGGSGTVKSVAGVEPDESGDVPLTPADIGAATEQQFIDLSEAIGDKLDKSGGTMKGKIILPYGNPNAGISNNVDTKLLGYSKDADGNLIFAAGEPNMPLVLRGSDVAPTYNGKKLMLEGEGSQISGLTAEQISALDGMFKVAAYTKDVTVEYAAFKAAFGIEDGGETEPDEPENPDTPEATLTSISAIYSGGDVPVGTAVTALTGITVTATYSDGSTATVTDYTISGTIAEGSNTITVSYGGKTATFAVNGVAESGGEEIASPLGVTWTEGIFLSSGKEYDNASKVASDYVDVSGKSTLSVYNDTGKLFQISMSYYDNGKTYIGSNGSQYVQGSEAYPSPLVITFPDGCNYVRLSTSIQAGSSTAGYVHYTELGYELA